MTKHSNSSLTPFQSAGQEVNKMLGYVNIADYAADKLGVDAPTRKKVKTGLVITALAVGAYLFFKKKS